MWLPVIPGVSFPIRIHPTPYLKLDIIHSHYCLSIFPQGTCIKLLPLCMCVCKFGFHTKYNWKVTRTHKKKKTFCEACSELRALKHHVPSLQGFTQPYWEHAIRWKCSCRGLPMARWLNAFRFTHLFVYLFTSFFMLMSCFCRDTFVTQTGYPKHKH